MARIKTTEKLPSAEPALYPKPLTSAEVSSYANSIRTDFRRGTGREEAAQEPGGGGSVKNSE